MKKPILSALLALSLHSPILHAEIITDLSKIKPIQCPTGEASAFSFMSFTPVPGFEEVAQVFPIVDRLAMAGGMDTVRLDVCLDAAGSPTLERVLEHMSSFS